MDCRSFRRHHLAFVDDTLPGILLVQMERHRQECERCAQRDAEVRRSLLLFRNHLPEIEPSADFSARLEARLERERRRNAAPLPVFRGPGLQSFLAMSVGVIALGFAAAAAGDAVQTHGIARLPAVVLRPEAPLSIPALSVTASPIPAPPTAFVASVSTGMAVWPALLLVEEAQSRYMEQASSGAVRPASYSPARDAR